MPAEAQLSGPSPVPTRYAAVRVGGVVARTFSTAWRRKWRLAAVTIVILGPAYALGWGASEAIARPGSLEARVVARYGFQLVLVFACMLLAGAHAHAAVQHLAGKTVRIGAMLGAALRRAPGLLGLLALGALGAVAAAFFVRALVEVFDAGLAFFLVMVASLLAAATVAAGFSLAIPVMAAERAGPLAALARSWQLTRGRRATILLAYCASGLVYLAILWAELLAVFVGLEGHAGIALAITAGLALAVLQLLVLPLVTLPAAVAYHDLRLEKEGASPEDLARVFV